MPRRVRKIGIVGGFDAAHIGGFLAAAAASLGYETVRFDTRDAWSGTRLGRALRWRFADRRPSRQAQFCKSVIDACVTQQIDLLISTGAVPLTREALRALHQSQVFCINYSTDDPWNPLSHARWFLRALSQYDIVASPRTANLTDLEKLGCRSVRYLPFAYDEHAHAPVAGSDVASHPVLFVGGADADRVDFVTTAIRQGLPVALAGSYWGRYAGTRHRWLGHKTPAEIRELTAAARVNLCLVRRQNRDGHVMRSFEIAAIGGCLLAEDTTEHRQIFGPDGEAVIYFSGPHEAAQLGRRLLADPDERARLSTTARARITGGAHSYRHRLETMIAWAQEC